MICEGFANSLASISFSVLLSHLLLMLALPHSLQRYPRNPLNACQSWPHSLSTTSPPFRLVVPPPNLLNQITVHCNPQLFFDLFFEAPRAKVCCPIACDCHRTTYPAHHYRTSTQHCILFEVSHTPLRSSKLNGGPRGMVSL